MNMTKKQSMEMAFVQGWLFRIRNPECPSPNSPFRKDSRCGRMMVHGLRVGNRDRYWVLMSRQNDDVSVVMGQLDGPLWITDKKVMSFLSKELQKMIKEGIPWFPSRKTDKQAIHDKQAMLTRTQFVQLELSSEVLRSRIAAVPGSHR